MSNQDSWGNYGIEPEKKRVNAGFSVGLIAGISMAFVRLIIMLAEMDSVQVYLLAALFQLLVYYLAGRSAAEQQYKRQINDVDYLKDVKGAGIGAALVTSLIVWLYFLIVAVFLDAAGELDVLQPLLMVCWVLVDVLIALAVGNAAGSSVEHRYRNS